MSAPATLQARPKSDELSPQDEQGPAADAADEAKDLDRSGARLGVGRRPPRFSIPIRIFLGFVLVAGAFGGVAIGSLVQHRRTSLTLRMLHEGYLPLALTIGEARATQTVFGTLLDRVVEEPGHSATRSWIEVARRVRPTTIKRAAERLDRAAALDATAEDRQVLGFVKQELDRVQDAYRKETADYQELFEAVESGQREQAQSVLLRVRARERSIRLALREAWLRLQARLASSSSEAAEQEARAAFLLGVLTLAALFVAVAVMWWSKRVLDPLPRLQSRVEAVGRGEFAQRLAVQRDDELGRLTEAFERMVEALGVRDRRLLEAAEERERLKRTAAIGRMAAHVTHEVRNPLSSIGLNVEVLEEELAGSPGEIPSLLREIRREVDRLAGITEEYLRLARLPEPRLEPENLGDLVSSVAGFMRKEMEASAITLVVHVADDLPTVTVDEAQIRQALLNLLGNARDASPPGAQILVEVRQVDAGVAIRVADAGPGVPEKIRERIYDPFFTTKEQGSGLGLPLTQQIAVAHRGRIRCTDAEGGGALFEIWLPQ